MGFDQFMTIVWVVLGIVGFIGYRRGSNVVFLRYAGDRDKK